MKKIIIFSIFACCTFLLNAKGQEARLEGLKNQSDLKEIEIIEEKVDKKGSDKTANKKQEEIVHHEKGADKKAGKITVIKRGSKQVVVD